MSCYQGKLQSSRCSERWTPTASMFTHRPMMGARTDISQPRGTPASSDFSIYRREAWTCYYVRLLNAANEGGCGYDLCLHQACPHLNLAVDHRITAVHGGDCCKRKTGNPCRWQQYQAVCGKADIWIARAGPCITQRPFGFPSLVNQSGTNPPSFGSKIKLG